MQPVRRGKSYVCGCDGKEFTMPRLKSSTRLTSTEASVGYWLLQLPATYLWSLSIFTAEAGHALTIGTNRAKTAIKLTLFADGSKDELWCNSFDELADTVDTLVEDYRKEYPAMESEIQRAVNIKGGKGPQKLDLAARQRAAE